jgi:hypothetical protein
MVISIKLSKICCTFNEVKNLFAGRYMEKIPWSWVMRTTYLQAAADAAKALIDSGKHSFHKGAAGRTYNELHSKKNLDGNKEVIFFQRYERGTRTNHVQSYNRGYNGGATKNMVEDYLCSDGLPISLSPLYKGDVNYGDIFVTEIQG